MGARADCCAVFSNAGTGLQVAAQAWFVWETTHSSPYLGLLGLVQATPLFGIPFLGGMLADRFPRRSILLLTQTALASAAALMGMLELAAVLSPLLVLLLAGLAASVAALDNPVRQAYLPGMVGANERGRTVGLNALAYNAGMVMGPALAGILLPSVGAGWCFILNAVSYLFVVGWLWKGPEGPPLCPARAEFGSVIAYVRKAPPLVNLLVLIALVSLLGRSFPSVLPLLVNQRWGGGAGRTARWQRCPASARWARQGSQRGSWDEMILTIESGSAEYFSAGRLSALGLRLRWAPLARRSY